MNSMTSFIYLILCFSFFFSSAHSIVMQPSSFLYERYIGEWSNELRAEDTDLPATYFLCEVGFREMQWDFLMYECNFIVSFFFNYQYGCKWKNQQLYTMTNGFKATFCHYQDWSKKIQKTLETGNAKSGNWRAYKCPKNQFVSKISPAINYFNGMDVGFVGVKMECKDINLNQRTTIEDKETIYKPTFSYANNPKGTFVSRLFVSYIKNDKLTGVQFTFEEVPIISNITFYYNKTTATLTPVLVAANQLQNNNGTKVLQKNFSVKKEFLTQHSWKNEGSLLLQNFEISSNATISQFQYIQGAIFNDTRVKLNGAVFGFEKFIQLPSSSSTQIAAVANPCQFLQLASYLIIQKITVPYTVVVTFAGKTSGKEIKISPKIKGVWTGVLPLTIKTDLIETAIKGCKVG